MLQKVNVKTIKLLVGVENKNLRFSFAVSKETCIFAKSKPLSYSIPIEQLRYSSHFSWAFFMPF